MRDESPTPLDPKTPSGDTPTRPGQLGIEPTGDDEHRVVID